MSVGKVMFLDKLFDSERASYECSQSCVSCKLSHTTSRCLKESVLRPPPGALGAGAIRESGGRLSDQELKQQITSDLCVDNQ